MSAQPGLGQVPAAVPAIAQARREGVSNLEMVAALHKQASDCSSCWLPAERELQI